MLAATANYGTGFALSYPVKLNKTKKTNKTWPLEAIIPSYPDFKTNINGDLHHWKKTNLYHLHTSTSVAWLPKVF